MEGSVPKSQNFSCEISMVYASRTPHALALLQRYCHICHVFLPDDEQLALHMKVKHSLPPHVRFVPLNPAFLSALHAQCVAEYHLLCPKESFYTSR